MYSSSQLFSCDSEGCCTLPCSLHGPLTIGCNQKRHVLALKLDKYVVYACMVRTVPLFTVPRVSYAPRYIEQPFPVVRVDGQPFTSTLPAPRTCV